MKKVALITSYFAVLGIVFLLNSCNDDPIIPNGGQGSDVDTTWVADSTTWNPNGGGNDSTNVNPTDTLGGFNPNDSLGGINPNDTL